MLTAEQIRASRAILRLEQSELAEMAGVSVETVRRLESQTGPVGATPETVEAVQAALRHKGIDFIDSSPEGGPGVRLALDKTKFLQEQATSYVASSFARNVAAHLQKDPNFFERDPNQTAQIMREFLDIDFKFFVSSAAQDHALLDLIREIKRKTDRSLHSRGSESTTATAAESWLKDEGVSLVGHRCQVKRDAAETMIRDWRKKVREDDPVPLAGILAAADRLDVTGDKFIRFVENAIWEGAFMGFVREFESYKTVLTNTLRTPKPPKR